jgi:hypothetical protein
MYDRRRRERRDGKFKRNEEVSKRLGELGNSKLFLHG